MFAVLLASPMGVLFLVLVLATVFAVFAHFAGDPVGMAVKFKLIALILFAIAILFAAHFRLFLMGLPNWLLTLLFVLKMAGILWVLLSLPFPGIRAYLEQSNPEWLANHDLLRLYRKFRVYAVVVCVVFVLLL